MRLAARVCACVHIIAESRAQYRQINGGRSHFTKIFPPPQPCHVLLMKSTSSSSVLLSFLLLSFFASAGHCFPVHSSKQCNLRKLTFADYKGHAGACPVAAVGVLIINAHHEGGVGSPRRNATDIRNLQRRPYRLRISPEELAGQCRDCGYVEGRRDCLKPAEHRG